MSSQKHKHYRVFIHVLLLIANLYTGLLLEFTHNHAIELTLTSNSAQQHFNVDHRATLAKHPCTACRLSSDRISVEARIASYSIVDIVISNIPQVVFAISHFALASTLGSRAPPA
jgi:hypothetical protein